MSLFPSAQLSILFLTEELSHIHAALRASYTYNTYIIHSMHSLWGKHIFRASSQQPVLPIRPGDQVVRLVHTHHDFSVMRKVIITLERCSKTLHNSSFILSKLFRFLKCKSIFVHQIARKKRLLSATRVCRLLRKVLHSSPSACTHASQKTTSNGNESLCPNPSAV